MGELVDTDRVSFLHVYTAAADFQHGMLKYYCVRFAGTGLFQIGEIFFLLRKVERKNP